VEPGVRLAEGVSVGAGAVIRTGVEIGAGCVIEEGAVLGKQPRLRPSSSAAAAARAASSAEETESPSRGGGSGPLVIESGATICCGAVVYAGARIGADVIVGDLAQIRERATVGAGSVVGRGSSVDFDVTVGERVLIQTGVYITGGTVIEDDVFIGPGVITTNDHTMGRHARGERLLGPTLQRACRVGGGAVLVPGVEIGEEAYVAAGAVVTRNVPPRGVAIGVPARVVREVSGKDFLERWR
jgi:acetyltransferase-like isoleucine patch superfamily enzyme